MIKFSKPVMLTTAGDGYWSNKHATVKINKLDLAYLSDEEDFGELRVYFDRTTWNVTRDGLIYTDSLFASELVTLLDTMGLAGSDVNYSEQGMQGAEYVSLDVGEAFIKSWMKKVVLTI